MPKVDRIEADQRREEPPIGLGDPVAGQITLARQPRLDEVQGREQGVEGGFVGLLAAGKAALVDAVVERVVNARVDGVDFAAQVLRIEIHGGIAEVVEGAVQHADDLGGLVIDDTLFFLVEQDRYRNPAREVWMGRGVNLAQESSAENRIGNGAVAAAEMPTVVGHVPVHHRHGDGVFQFLEFAEDERPVGPGAGVGQVQMVTPGLGLEAGRSVGRHPVADSRLGALKGALAAAWNAIRRPLAVNQLAHGLLLAASSGVLRSRPELLHCPTYSGSTVVPANRAAVKLEMPPG